MQFLALPGWGLLPLVVGVVAGMGSGLLSVCVLGARGLCSCVVVCGMVFLVFFVVPFVWVFVWVWCVWRPLAEANGGSSPLFLAGVCGWRWRAVPCQSWPRALGALPRHSWLTSAGVGGGWSHANPG